ncbi:hypothetical protein [Candidatus Colwellia aromaticivorans]|uniref:hypothetical protein n=1 Tax=Candidatus Colwellia aromaticivorans TaxID=2267621 RepID=UPI000DF1E4BD|nr:hypothetical protein [Candidatus Colwellia aromaticivorans]
MKTKILNLQFAFFLRDIVERPDLEFGELNSRMLNAFDAMPQMIPTPRELPPEVPVMILKSSNGMYNCNISRSRIDFTLVRIDENKSNSDILKDFNAKLSGLIKYILEKQEVVRFGMIARYFHKDNTAVRTLRNKYFTNSVDGSEELSLRYNKPTNSFGYTVNDILEISAVDAVNNGVPEKGILVLRDINNTLKPNTHFDFSTLSQLSQKYAPKLSEAEIEVLVK